MHCRISLYIVPKLLCSKSKSIWKILVGKGRISHEGTPSWAGSNDMCLNDPLGCVVTKNLWFYGVTLLYYSFSKIKHRHYRGVKNVINRIFNCFWTNCKKNFAPIHSWSHTLPPPGPWSCILNGARQFSCTNCSSPELTEWVLEHHLPWFCGFPLWDISVQRGFANVLSNQMHMVRTLSHTTFKKLLN